jgi:hypothetical protein
MIMAAVFWDLGDGSSLENFMQYKATVTDAAVLLDLKVVVSEGRIGKVTCSSASSQRCCCTQTTKSSPSCEGLWL